MLRLIANSIWGHLRMSLFVLNSNEEAMNVNVRNLYKKHLWNVLVQIAK